MNTENSTNVSSVTQSPMSTADSLFDKLFLYMSPFLIIPGVIGNILSLIVLQSRFYRRAPSSFILSALACVDTGALLNGLLAQWINSFTILVLQNAVDVRLLSIASCKITAFLAYYLNQLSSWSLVLVTLERLASVVIPFKSKELFSKRRMIIGWSITAFVLAALCGHFFTFTLVDYESQATDNITQSIKYCETIVYMNFDYNIYPWIDLVVVSLVPFSTIIVCNAIIINKIIRSKKFNSNHSSAAGNDEARSITIMLVAISITFLLTTTPACIFFVGYSYWPEQNLETAFAICALLYFTANSSNFLIYCVTGQSFRKAVAVVFCCRPEKPKVIAEYPRVNAGASSVSANVALSQIQINID